MQRMRLRGFALVMGILSTTTAFAEPAWFSNGRMLNNDIWPHSRSICGTDDNIDMDKAGKSYQQMGRPVGLYMMNNRGACTGAMISEDLFLTARHCATSCDKIAVRFGWYKGSKTATYKCTEIVEKGGSAKNQDYMIIRLDGKPGKTWGFYGVSARKLEPSQPLLMIHHPAAKPMKVSKEGCAVYSETGGMLNHRCDTRPGSSGSSILVLDQRTYPALKVVGVHGYGGCFKNGKTSSNSGPSMNQLISLSPILRKMAANERAQFYRRYGR